MTRHELNDVFATTSFLQGANAAYLEQLYASYQQAPNSVGPEWQAFFASLKDDKDDVLFQARGPSWKPSNGLEARVLAPTAFTEEQALAAAKDTLAARTLIRTYRTRGHLIAKLDPLELVTRREHPELKTQDLRLHQGRLRPPDLSRWCARARIRHAARSARHLEAHLLRPAYRRRIHAHLRPRAAAVDPGPHRGPRRRDPLHACTARRRSSRSSSRPRSSSASSTSNIPAPSASASTAASRWCRRSSRSSNAAASSA